MQNASRFVRCSPPERACWQHSHRRQGGKAALPVGPGTSFLIDAPRPPCDASGAAGPGWARPPSFPAHGRAMADNIPMTRAGADAIKRELKRLKSVERPRNVQDIAVARDHGAKERQSHIEGRIQMLEDRLARAQIIDVSKLSGGRVVFGATVKLEDSDSGARTQYTIVGETEADLKKGRISITSPIARGLIGREVGDSAKIHTPGGEREYEILEVVFVEYALDSEEAEAP